MADLDLIPRDYARSRGLEASVRRFVAALVAILVLVALGRAGIEYLISRNSEDVARLRARGQLSAQQAAKADAVRKRKLATEKQLEELDQLRGRDRLALLLRAIDSAFYEGIWFDELRFFRRENVTTPTLGTSGAAAGILVVPKDRVPAPGSTIKPPEIEQQVEIAGHAVSHTRLAEFMRALGRQRGIADVRLLDTGTRNYTNAVVVDVKLALSIDENARGTR